jgi:hypothetical protein
MITDIDFLLLSVAVPFVHPFRTQLPLSKMGENFIAAFLITTGQPES